MLCTEAALAAMRRRYPQVYESERKLAVDPRWSWELGSSNGTTLVISYGSCSL